MQDALAKMRRNGLTRQRPASGDIAEACTSVLHARDQARQRKGSDVCWLNRWEREREASDDFLRYVQCPGLGEGDENAAAAACRSGKVSAI